MKYAAETWKELPWTINKNEDFFILRLVRRSNTLQNQATQISIAVSVKCIERTQETFLKVEQPVGHNWCK